jgi:type IV pilus assembly protein PilM
MNLGWKQSFKLQPKEVLGLDIGSSLVKIVQLHKDNGSYRVVAAGISEIAANQDDGDYGEISTTKAVRKCLKSAGASTHWAVCGVSGPEVAVRYFKFPSLQPEEVEGAVLLEAAQVCPFNVDEATVDFQVISNEGHNATGVLVAATSNLIKSKQQLVKNGSLSCVLMDVEGLALLNCFNGFKGEEEKKGYDSGITALLNVGNSHTTLAIMGDKGLPFIRDISHGGKDIIEQLADENDASQEDVRRILWGDGDSNGGLHFGDGFAKACQKLTVDITETLRYYTTQEKSSVLEEIHVCGGFGLVKGFVELLDSQVAARVVLWNPFEGIKCDSGRRCADILSQQGPALAVAAGLGMRSI